MFSVVITVYNKAAFVSSSIQEVLNQTCQDFELIILNDGSEDEGETEILKFRDRRIRYVKQKNQGASAARNAAIALAKFPYIALKDADDSWLPNYLEIQQKAILEYPHISVFATAVIKQMQHKQWNYQYSVDCSATESVEVDFFEASQITPILHSSSAVFHQSVFQTVGNYNTAYVTGEDTDFYIRVGLKFKLVFTNAYLVKYQVHANSLFRRETPLDRKPDYAEYHEEEQTNPALKRFLDRKRYSYCIAVKIAADQQAFQKVYAVIASENLTRQQRFWLRQPSWVLRFLKPLKDYLELKGSQIGTLR